MIILLYVLVAILLHGLYRLLAKWLQNDHSTYVNYFDNHLKTNHDKK